jgi:hypothetical protein
MLMQLKHGSLINDWKVMADAANSMEQSMIMNISSFKTI